MDDFEWGVLNGKFDALEWVRGTDWDQQATLSLRIRIAEDGDVSE